MHRRLVLLALTVLAFPGSALASGGGGVVASYDVSWAGATDPAAGTAAAAHWEVDSHVPRGNSDGTLPATLTAATLDPYVQGGSDAPDGCTSTHRLAGITSAAGRLRFAVNFDLIHGRGLVQAYPSDADNGMVHLQDETACPGSDQIQDVDAPAWQLFTGYVPLGHDWAVTRRKGTNVWSGGGTQQFASVNGAPFVQSVKLTLTGAPGTFNAGCKVPTVRQLHSARTRAAAVRVLRRAGLKVERGSPTSLPASYVKRGHFFVFSQVTSAYEPCGDGVILARSTGSSTGPVGSA